LDEEQHQQAAGEVESYKLITFGTHSVYFERQKVDKKANLH